MALDVFSRAELDEVTLADSARELAKLSPDISVVVMATSSLGELLRHTTCRKPLRAQVNVIALQVEEGATPRMATSARSRSSRSADWPSCRSSWQEVGRDDRHRRIAPECVGDHVDPNEGAGPPQPDLVDAGFLVGMLVLALIGFRTTFDTPVYLAWGVLGILLGVGLSHVAGVLRQPIVVIAGLVIAAYFLVGGFVGARERLLGGVVPTVARLCRSVVGGDRWVEGPADDVAAGRRHRPTGRPSLPPRPARWDCWLPLRGELGCRGSPC